jgi:hypothetical protein
MLEGLRGVVLQCHRITSRTADYPISTPAQFVPRCRTVSVCADNAGQLLASRHKKSPLAVSSSCDGGEGNSQEALTLLPGHHTQRI